MAQSLILWLHQSKYTIFWINGTNGAWQPQTKPPGVSGGPQKNVHALQLHEILRVFSPQFQ